MKCGDCHGDGVIGDWPITCPTCKGEGVVRSKFQLLAEDFKKSMDAWELAARLGVRIDMDFQTA